MEEEKIVYIRQGDNAPMLYMVMLIIMVVFVFTMFYEQPKGGFVETD